MAKLYSVQKNCFIFTEFCCLRDMMQQLFQLSMCYVLPCCWEVLSGIFPGRVLMVFFHLCEKPQYYKQQIDLASTLTWLESILLPFLLVALSLSWQYTCIHHSPFLIPLSLACWYVQVLIYTCRDNILQTEELSISTKIFSVHNGIFHWCISYLQLRKIKLHRNCSFSMGGSLGSDN